MSLFWPFPLSKGQKISELFGQTGKHLNDLCKDPITRPMKLKKGFVERAKRIKGLSGFGLILAFSFYSIKWSKFQFKILENKILPRLEILECSSQSFSELASDYSLGFNEELHQVQEKTKNPKIR